MPLSLYRTQKSKKIMILKIKSKNEHLLDILFKNPNTDYGLYFKSLKNGQIVGNAVNKNHYEVVFQDTKYSYLPEESNQIDFQSYCSPLVVLHICNELFGHVLKSKEEFTEKPIQWLNLTQGEIDTESCSIEIPSFYIDSNWFRDGRFLPTKYFEGVEIEQQTNRIFKLTVTAKSVFEAFNLLVLISLFTHITNNYTVFTYIDDQLAQKYGRILTNIENVPYFVFYLFIMKAVKSERQFNELKPIFEEYLGRNGLKANLVMQGTYLQRIYYITKQLDLDIPILDIGCGELTYYKRMMAKEFSATYYAVDKDPQFERISENISRRYDEDNLVFYNSLDQFKSGEQINILLTEVIEHNPREEADTLIKGALSYNFNKLLITTPNVEFNQYYTMDSELRHDDHNFELTRKEFEELIEDCILDMSKPEQYKVEFFQLGDSLNDIQPTQGCIITKS